MSGTTESFAVNQSDQEVVDYDAVYDYNLYWSIYYLFPALHLTLAGFVFLTNILVIIAFIKFKRLRTLMNYFIVNLAVADIGIAMDTILCRSLVLENRHSPMVTHVVCLAKYWFGISAMIISMMSLLLVAVERYIKLFYALRYAEILTHRRTMFGIVFTWLAGLATAGLGIAFHRYSYEYICNPPNVFSKVFAVYVFGSMFIPYIMVMIFIYGKVWLLTRKHRNSIAIMDTSESDERQRKKRQKDIKITLMMAYIIAMVIFAYGLFIVVNIIGYMHEGRGARLGYRDPMPKFAANFFLSEGIMGVIVCINSAINPLIYHWKNANFRYAFQQILRCNVTGQEEMSDSNMSQSYSLNAKNFMNSKMSAVKVS